MPKHVVEQGECINSIAATYGFFPATLWEHESNAGLRRRRQDPNVLYAGDVVNVPEKRNKVEACVTTKWHCFRLRGVPARLRLRFCRAGVPRAHEPYEVWVDEALVDKGTTGDDGEIDVPISPTAKTGRVVLGQGPRRREFPIELGHLDPLDKTTGIKARLRNLGHYGGEIDDDVDDALKAAVRSFQTTQGLAATGECDEATIQALKTTHGEG